MIRINQPYDNIRLINKIPTLLVLIGLTIVITSVFMITLGKNVFAIEYTKYINNKYETDLDYSNAIYLNSIHNSIDQRDNGMIVLVGANFKESNQHKINSCAQSYHNQIPKIYRDDESYWEGSLVACTYGLYNYNVNIGNKNMDPILRIQIEGEAEICMLDDHCIKKIKNIIKGEIALQSSGNVQPKVNQKEEEQQYSPEVLEYEKNRKEAQKGTYLDIPLEERLARGPYTTTDKDKEGFIDRDEDEDEDDKKN